MKLQKKNMILGDIIILASKDKSRRWAKVPSQEISDMLNEPGFMEELTKTENEDNEES